MVPSTKQIITTAVIAVAAVILVKKFGPRVPVVGPQLARWVA